MKKILKTILDFFKPKQQQMKKPVMEYGGKEKYASPAAKAKHEKKEVKKVEKKEAPKKKK
jgi:hypothetical protein